MGKPTTAGLPYTLTESITSNGERKSMNRIVLLLALLVIGCGPNKENYKDTSALIGKTRGGDAACLKKEDVTMVIRLAQSKAQESAMSYFQTDKCMILKGGKRVVIIKGSGTTGAMIQFHYRRFVLWSAREAVSL